VLVAEPSPPDGDLIAGVDDEIHVVADILRSASAEAINDINPRPSVQSVLDSLPAAHVLHLACHGHQDQEPLQSNFALNDGPLTIASLMNLNLPNAMFSFLSACETAKGDQNQPDQAVHLAASMLFCGFRSIIATMWSAIPLMKI
jgi:CHAT domain-containing protein